MSLWILYMSRLFKVYITNVFLWAETVNWAMRRSVRGLGLNAQCASGGVHTLLYTDGATNLCQSGRSLWERRAAGLKLHRRTKPGQNGRTEGMCRFSSTAQQSNIRSFLVFTALLWSLRTEFAFTRGIEGLEWMKPPPSPLLSRFCRCARNLKK